jgi:hypothetical protein
VLGLAWMLTAGTAPATVTVADCIDEPPGPVQVNTNSVELESLPDNHLPLVDIPPCQPSEAVQAVALVVDHDKVVMP